MLSGRPSNVFLWFFFNRSAGVAVELEAEQLIVV